MYTIFKDLVSKDYYVISFHSIEYPDYMDLVQAKKMEKVFDGTRKECHQYLEENRELV